jgi:hypothetical protein
VLTAILLNRIQCGSGNDPLSIANMPRQFRNPMFAHASLQNYFCKKFFEYVYNKPASDNANEQTRGRQVVPMNGTAIRPMGMILSC